MSDEAISSLAPHAKSPAVKAMTKKNVKLLLLCWERNQLGPVGQYFL